MKKSWAVLTLAALLAGSALLPQGGVQAASLEGTVQDAETGVMLAGALVAVSGNDPNQPFDSTWTNVHGHYVLHELSEGMVAVTSWKEGYLPFQATIELRPGGNLLDIGLVPAGGSGSASLAGHVQDALDGHPLHGVHVMVMEPNGADTLMTMSNGDGNFRVEGLQPGSVGVTLMREGYQTLMLMETLEEGENPRVYELQPTGGAHDATLLGHVLADGGVSVPGALVMLGGPAMMDSLWTNDEGAFLAENLVSGPLHVHILAEGFHPYQSEIFLASGPNEASFLLTSQDGSATLDGLVSDEDGEPIAMATATLWTGNWATEAMTGEDGHFHMENLSPGWASLMVEAMGYEGSSQQLLLADGPNDVTVSLTPDETDPAGLVSGTVLDALTRLPLVDATVSFYGGGAMDSLVTTTDAAGAFSVTLPASDAPGWRVTVTHEGYLAGQRWIPAQGHHGAWLFFLLQPEIGAENWGLLAGNVATADGERVLFAELEAITADPSVPPFSWSYFTAVDELGHYELPVPPGVYILSCHAWILQPMGLVEVRVYWPGTHDMDAATPLHVEENEVLDGLDFTLPAANSPPLQVLVDGTVRDEDGVPLAGAQVRVWTPWHELADAAATSDAGGAFQTTILLDRLPIVPFSLSAEREGFLMEFFAGAPDFPTATQFMVSGDAVFHNVDFSLPAELTGLSLAGQVQTEDGQGSVLVVAVGPQGDFLATAAADGTGHFAFNGLADEALALLYYAPGCRPAYSGDALGLGEAELVWPGGNPQATLATEPVAVGPCALAGHVRDQDGQALAGALVLAHTPATGDLRHAFSGPLGAFLVEGLAPQAVVELHVSRPGFTDLVSTLALDGGNSQTTQTELILETGGTGLPQVDRPGGLELAPAAPNPFNPTTLLSYTLPQAGNLRLELFNLRGALVSTLASGPQTAGTHRLVFDGGGLASGLYLLRLESAGQARVQRLLLLK